MGYARRRFFFSLFLSLSLPHTHTRTCFTLLAPFPFSRPLHRYTTSSVSHVRGTTKQCVYPLLEQEVKTQAFFLFFFYSFSSPDLSPTDTNEWPSVEKKEKRGHTLQTDVIDSSVTSPTPKASISSKCATYSNTQCTGTVSPQRSFVIVRICDAGNLQVI